MPDLFPVIILVGMIVFAIGMIVGIHMNEYSWRRSGDNPRFYGKFRGNSPFIYYVERYRPKDEES